MTTAFIGQPVSRVDGRQKVTGRATYAAEFDVPGLAHGVIVRSTVANGRIASIDSAAAERAPGVVAVLTHRNAPRLAYRPHKAVVDAAVGERLHVLQDDRVSHQGQPIALVIAETLEQANHAATLVRITYAPETGTTDISRVDPVLPTRQQGGRPSETRRGDPEGALATAEVKVDQTYVIPRENHNPIEMHATIAAWDGDRLTLWDKTQWVHNVGRRDRRRVRHSGREHPRHLTLRRRRLWFSAAHLAACDAGRARRPRGQAAGQGDAVAARDVLRRRLSPAHGPARRPRRIARRPPRGHRARRTPGDLHLRGVFGGAPQRDRVPAFVPERLRAPSASRAMNVHTPTYMRAPGEASGIFALESAMDELAVALNVDPVELRLRNEPEQDEGKKLPFSSRSTRECYRAAAERFGWSRRNPEPRSMRDGRWLIGWGMATATYPMNYAPASAMARLLPDGTAEVMSASSDMGPGTWTSDDAGCG